MTVHHAARRRPRPLRAFFAVSALLAPLTVVTLVSAPASAQGVRVLPRDTAAAGPSVLDPSALTPLFTEGAPAEAPRRLAAGEASRAADDLAEWLRANPRHPHVAEAGFLYGWALYEANRHTEAEAVLEAAAEALPLLADHAYYHAAMAAFEEERWDAAETLAQVVPEGSVYAPRARFLRGRALRAAGRHGEAIELLGAFAERYPRAFYIASVELELARARRDAGQYAEAARTFARVRNRYPGSDEEGIAERELGGVLEHLPSGERAAFRTVSDDDLLARATALFDRHRSDEVIALLSGELERLDPDTALGCQAVFLVAKSYSKLRQHGEAVPFYRTIVDSACPDEDLVVKSWYTLGQALWNVDRDAEAIDAFTALYQRYAHHTYADDALLYVARIERSNGNDERYVALLEEQVRRFPEGDMLGDANWLLFENDFAAGRYESAAAFVEALGPRSGENSLYNNGRLAYFRARSLHLDGLASRAEDAYAEVVRGYPLSYYALLAANRLRQLDPARADELLRSLHPDAVLASDSVPIEPAEVADELSFQRGLLLLRLGLLDLAQAQFDELTDAYPNQTSVLWLVTYLFDRVGAYHISHDIPRRRIEDFLGSYPDATSLRLWQLAYPLPFEDEIREAAAARNLDPFLVYAIMREESGFNPRAESWANARGLMQLMLPTAEDMAERVGMRSVRARDLFRPEVAIPLGAEFLRTLATRYDDHPALTIAGYNGGAGNVNRFLTDNGRLPLDQFIEEIPFRQTRDYAKRVLMTLWIYHWLYDAERPLVELPFDVSRLVP